MTVAFFETNAHRVTGSGAIDLSETPNSTTYKALSWWTESGAKLHAFFSVGQTSEPLMSGCSTLVEQLRDILPLLNVDQPSGDPVLAMDVFAANSQDVGMRMDIAGVYLGSIAYKAENSPAEYARSLMNHIGKKLPEITELLWGLWDQPPYAYDGSEIQGWQVAHHLTFNPSQIVLESRSLIKI